MCFSTQAVDGAELFRFVFVWLVVLLICAPTGSGGRLWPLETAGLTASSRFPLHGYYPLPSVD